MVPEAYMDGGPAKVDGKYTLDPGSPDVQQYLTSIIRELVTNYAIDGINFDYIRYVQTDAGYPADASYAKSSLARFQALEGYGGTPPPEGSTASGRLPPAHDQRARAAQPRGNRINRDQPATAAAIHRRSDLLGRRPGEFPEQQRLCTLPELEVLAGAGLARRRHPP